MLLQAGDQAQHLKLKAFLEAKELGFLTILWNLSLIHYLSLSLSLSLFYTRTNTYTQ